MGALTRATLLYDYDQAPLDHTAINWDLEIDVLASQRLAGVAQRVLRDRGIDPPPHIEDQLRNANFYWSQVTLAVTAMALHDLRSLTDHRIPFVVTKGPGIASIAKRFIERPYADIDIMVDDNDFSRARATLATIGYVEEDKDMVPRPSLDVTCREAVNLHSPSGGSIDIHHRIPPWYWATKIGFGDLMSGSLHVTVAGGATLPCVSFADNLLISALHIISDKNKPGATLMAWRDFLMLAHATDPGEALVRAQATDLCGWMKWVMGAFPPSALPPNLVAAFAAQERVVSGPRRLAIVTSPGLPARRSILNQVARLPVRNGALYLLGLMWPSRSFLKARVGDVTRPRLAWLFSVIRNKGSSNDE